MAEVPDYSSVIRITAIDGGDIVTIRQHEFSPAVGGGKVDWIEPVGWLNNIHLLVQVYAGDWSNPSIVMIRFDGSGMTQLASGAFIGFTYP